LEKTRKQGNAHLRSRGETLGGGTRKRETGRAGEKRKRGKRGQTMRGLKKKLLSKERSR